MSRQELERLDDLGMAAWDNHKPAAFVALFADDFVVRDLTVPAPIRTREQVMDYMESWFTAFPDLRVRVTNRVIGVDSVAAETEFTGTNTGPLSVGGVELPPTGRSVVVRGAYFTRVKDMRIVEFNAHPDAAGVLAQLGVISPG